MVGTFTDQELDDSSLSGDGEVLVLALSLSRSLALTDELQLGLFSPTALWARD